MTIYYCIDAYKETDESWSLCPKCGLRTKVWSYDNGRSTACSCGENDYVHFSIHAESIMSCLKNKTEYDRDGLKNNWNHWCETGEVLFEHASKRTDGRW